VLEFQVDYDQQRDEIVTRAAYNKLYKFHEMNHDQVSSHLFNRRKEGIDGNEAENR